MAHEVEFADGDTGKVRSFGVGMVLYVITLGMYYWFWYYLLNDELKDIGVSVRDPKLSDSRPGSSLAAVTIGQLLFLPPLISVYNHGKRIRRAQGLLEIPIQQRINPVLSFLCVFPLGLLIVPAIFHYWYVTKHQNIAVRAAAAG